MTKQFPGQACYAFVAFCFASGYDEAKVAARLFAAKRDQTKYFKAGDEAKVGATMPERARRSCEKNNLETKVLSI